VPETFDHEAALETIPHEPGCYLMKDDQGRVIYVGKSKDLYDRVRSYFQSSGDDRAFVSRLPVLLSEIETIITSNEKEALILENTLIKKHEPRFNVRLKDDKNFLSLRIDRSDEWPRVEIVRQQEEGDDARYFGPYSSATAIRDTLDVVNKHFQLRTCPDSVLENRSRPCLQHQIDRCPAPCVYDIDREAYVEQLEDAIMFLEGRGEELVEELREKMESASAELEFELAARYRDQLRAIEQVLERQVAVNAEHVDRDVFGLYREGDRVAIDVLYVRGGTLQGADSFAYEDQEFSDEEILSSFLNLYYSSESSVPNEVLLPVELSHSELEAFEAILGDMAERDVEIGTAETKEERDLVETARRNAEQTYRSRYEREIQQRELLEDLQERLDLQNLPVSIECYDISNLQGDQIVASKVSFREAEPDKEGYRHYKMREVDSQDDFASMREVLERRLRKVADGAEEAPDLLVIDGGKGQLGRATAVLEQFGLPQIDVIALAKSRDERIGPDSFETTRSPERIFRPDRSDPVILDQNSAEMHLLQRLRDEAHRFAVKYHEKLRRSEKFQSRLDQIPGVGTKTKRRLLRHFGGLESIEAASVEALTDVSGIGTSRARTIRDFFRDSD
jgi:excinuclease ABC subunit C